MCGPDTVMCGPDTAVRTRDCHVRTRDCHINDSRIELLPASTPPHTPNPSGCLLILSHFDAPHSNFAEGQGVIGTVRKPWVRQLLFCR
ncbi:uncharacterized protein YALI1_B10757g [Yarrowia lipolytica]|uniref:Uncharacterized protein n=1 Tax=Yarrowia lipolytica TaxID=4952 RepID=A0A1D8N6Y2_YARLL|nr:hypothetical protein YALI1_B10757g [Yarrowia lipolytica]